MIAYKGFRPGMICIDYQFQMGLNVTDKANCRQNGFHCAENPLDCLNYYGDIDHSEYYIVNAGGDIDEDEVDSKISCTELTVLKRLTKEELLLHGLAFMADHPKRKWNKHVRKDRAEARGGYAVVRGADPIARAAGRVMYWPLPRRTRPPAASSRSWWLPLMERRSCRMSGMERILRKGR